MTKGWEELIIKKIKQNNKILLTHNQFVYTLQEIIKHPQCPIRNLEYEVKSILPFRNYRVGLNGNGKSKVVKLLLNDNRNSICKIKYQSKTKTEDLSNTHQLLEDLFESFWKPFLRTKSAGLPDLKRDTTVYSLAQNTVRNPNSFPCSVLFCDLDDFKKINDEFTHTYGDQIIIDVASILEFIAKGNAIVMHNGGDEFVILVVKGNYETSKKLAEDIKFIITKKFDKVAKIKKRKIKVSISIGIATARNNRISFKNLVRSADANLLKNKKKRWYRADYH